MQALEKNKDMPASEEQRWLQALERLHVETSGHGEFGAEGSTCIVTFTRLNDNRKHLRIAPNRSVDFEAGPGPWGFHVASVATGNTLVISALGHPTTPAYLAPNPTPVAPGAAATNPADFFTSDRGLASAYLPSPSTNYEWGIVGPSDMTPVKLMNGVQLRFFHLPTNSLIPQVFRAEAVDPNAMEALYKQAAKTGDWRTATDRPGAGVGFFRFQVGGVNPVARMLGAVPPSALHAAATSGRLRIDERLAVDLAGGQGPWATFRVDLAPGSAPSVFSIQCVGHMWRGDRAFLTSSNPGAPGFGAFAPTDRDRSRKASLRTLTPADRAALPGWKVEVLPDDAAPVREAMLGVTAAAHTYFDAAAAAAALPPAKMAEFRRTGFIVLQRAVARSLVDEARAFVNNQLGKGPAAWADDTTDGLKLRHASHPSLTATVYRSSVSSAVQRLFGGPGTLDPIGGVQLAIRFPVDKAVNDGDPKAAFGDPVPPSRPEFDQPRPINVVETNGWHIDGMGSDRMIPFSLLLLVAIGDQEVPGRGNFTVWPGEHRNPDVRRWYRAGRNLKTPQGGRTEEFDAWAAKKPPLATKSHQVLMKAGDVALVHPHLPHAVGQNMSADVRYTLIMRLRHRNDAEHQARALDNCLFDIFDDAPAAAAAATDPDFDAV